MIIISASDLGSLEQVQFSLTRFSKIISQICIANALSKTFQFCIFYLVYQIEISKSCTFWKKNALCIKSLFFMKKID